MDIVGALILFAGKCIGAVVLLFSAILAGFIGVFILRLVRGADFERDTYTPADLMAACIASCLSVFYVPSVARGLAPIHFIPVLAWWIISAWRQHRRVTRAEEASDIISSGPSKRSKIMDFLRGD